MYNNETKFSRLNKILTRKSGLIEPENDGDVIIRGTSPQDVELQYKEIKQQKFLNSQTFSVEKSRLQQIMHYEAQRIHAFIDYEGMEYYPLIASALDLYMEEATTIGDNGKMLNIYSSSSRVKKILEEFFYNTLNINVNLPSWTRNLVKYGDNFLNLSLSRTEGVVAVKQMLNMTIERKEEIIDNKLKIYFKKRDNAQELSKLEVVHFRLLGDDKYLPYGSSILNKIRKYWRMLILAEDAMLSYRILRAGDKRAIRVDVGNMASEDILAYVEEFAKSMKRKPTVNPNNANIDYRFNIMGNDEDYYIPTRNGNSGTMIETVEGACLALDTKIELLDGRSLELSKIIEEFKNGSNELWSYSINPETGEIVPGKITWAGVTRKDTQVLKITLDNGETITSTPDHKFPTKYNGVKEAKDLTVGESMWAFNKKYSLIKGSGVNEYEKIFNHKNNEWLFTHRMVANYMKSKNLHEELVHKFNGKRGTIHHKNFNRYDNTPNNLCFMNSKDHFYLHHDYANEMYNTYTEEQRENHKILRKAGREIYWNNITNSELNKKIETAVQNSLISRDKSAQTFRDNPNREELLKKRGKSISKAKSLNENVIKSSEISKLLWQNEDFRTTVIEKQSIKYSHKLLDLLIDYTNVYEQLDKILENCINTENSEWLIEFNSINQNNKQLKKMSCITNNNINKMVKHFGYKNWRDFSSKIPQYNHKIVSIEYLDERQDTGTITIDGDEELHDYHNFALTCGIFTKNSNLDKIADIEYLRDLVFTGLGIPKPFLGYQQTAGEGKNMGQLDMRFSKKVNRIQQALIQELNNMAMIHLYMLGFEDEFENFTLSLSPPSTQADILKTEFQSNKMQLYTDMTSVNDGSIAATSHTYAKMHVFNWSEEEILIDLERQFMERIVTQEIQNATTKISKSGVFDNILNKFGLKPGEVPIGNAQEDGEGGGGDAFGGDMSDLMNEPSGQQESKNALFDGTKEKATANLLKENSKTLIDKSKNIINEINKDK